MLRIAKHCKVTHSEFKTGSVFESSDSQQGPSPRLCATFVAAFADIKLHHTVFALPFAVLGAFVAGAPAAGQASLEEVNAGDWPRFGGQLALVVACMFFARTWAMLVNRVADRRFDAANPRTAGRAIPSGRIGAWQAMGVAAGSAAAFVACCVGFWVFFGNVWPAALSAPALAWIAWYSFTKRFTAWSHLFLGGALAASPLAAAVAVRPAAVVEAPAIWAIAAMVLLWVAGFDVIYALQDERFDRLAGLCSAPAAVGWRGAVWISRSLHAGAAGSLIAAWALEPRFGAVFGVGVAMTAGLLTLEHLVLARRGLAGLPMAFFTVNGVVSLALGALGCLDAVI